MVMLSAAVGAVGGSVLPRLSSAGGVDLVVFFLIGLFGGAHCIGMCGPLVTMYAERMEGGERNVLTLHEVRQHTLFNLGRTMSYATIGAIFGAAGGIIFVASGTVTEYVDLIRGFFGVVVGGFIAFAGVYYLAGRTGLDTGLPLGGFFKRVHSALSSRAGRWVDGFGVVGLGALHGFLPCPILYPAFLYVFAVGSPLNGFVSLAALGAGTIPAVFGYGVLIGSVGVTARRRIHRLLGVAFIVLSYILIQHGLMQFGVHLPRLKVPFYQPLS